MSTFTWTATTSEDWSTAAQWSPASVPGASDSALISATGTAYVVTVGTGESFGITNVTVNSDQATLKIDGTLAATGAVAITNGTLSVSGLLSGSGGSLTLTPASVSNTGTISGKDEAVVLGGAWTNKAGTIALTGASSLTLGGAFKTADIGTITGASGVTLTGGIDNSGATLDVGTGTELGTVTLGNTGVVSGGTIVDHGNGFSYPGGNGTFSGVTYQGPLTIGNNGGRLSITNGLTVTGAGGVGPGTINLTNGGGAAIVFVNSQTIDNATINLNGTNSFNPATEIDSGNNGSGPTLGPNLTVSSTAKNTHAGISGANNAQTSVVNQGTIIAAAAHDSDTLSTFGISPFNGFSNEGVIQISNGEFFSIQPGFGFFNNTGMVSVTGASTLQITAGSGTPISNTGTITMGSGRTLQLTGSYMYSSLGNLVNQGATTQIGGTLDGENGTIALGAGTKLNTINLTGQVRNATIAANNSFNIIPGNASLQNVTFQGDLNVTKDFATLTIFQGVTETDATGTLPGTVNVTGQGDVVNFNNNFPASGSDGQTLDNVTINVGNSLSADNIRPAFFGGTFTIGSNANIVSSTAGALVTFTQGTNTTIILNGTLTATGKGGTFTINGASSPFSNNGVIMVGNSDTLVLNAAISAGSGGGMIDVGTHGLVTVKNVAVASDQTFAFIDTTGSLSLSKASSFAAAIAGFSKGNVLDLVNTAADKAVWSAGLPGQNGTLAITNGGSAVATLSIAGNYSGLNFNVGSDSSGGTDITVDVCFAAGTRIATPGGEVPVEKLAVGDTVLTLDGRPQPIVWIGTGRVMVTPGHRSPATPVIVRRGALADNVPCRDLRVTKGHSLFIDDVLIPVEFLVNHRSIVWDDRAKEIEIYHIELPQHGVLVADGAAAESYRDDGNRWLFQNANAGWHLPPQPPCSAVLTGGPIVDAIWCRLLDRAGPRPGMPLTADPDLHLLVDGQRIDGTPHAGGVHVFRLMQRPTSVRIFSRAGAPEELGIARDPRMLGVALRQVAIWRGARPTVIDASDRSLGTGFHGFEDANGFRWTNGDALLPAELFDGIDGACSLELHVACTTRYPLFEDTRQDGRAMLP